MLSMIFVHFYCGVEARKDDCKRSENVKRRNKELLPLFLPTFLLYAKNKKKRKSDVMIEC